MGTHSLNEWVQLLSIVNMCINGERCDSGEGCEFISSYLAKYLIIFHLSLLYTIFLLQITLHSSLLSIQYLMHQQSPHTPPHHSPTRDSPTPLQNLSPLKYGKGAYANLTFTPSRLADHPLYRQTNTLKQVEQKMVHLRQTEAVNHFLKNKVANLTREKDTIEETLTKRVQMYKGIIQKMEESQLERITQMDRVFTEEKQTMIREKEQEAKFVQAQKQLLEGRIEELQGIVKCTEKQLEELGSGNGKLEQKLEELQTKSKEDEEKIKELQKVLSEERQKARNETEQLQRKIFTMEVEHTAKLEKKQVDFERAIQQIKAQIDTQIQEMQAQHNKELQQRAEEAKSLATAFESQAARLNDMLQGKQSEIDQLETKNMKLQDEVRRMTQQHTEAVLRLSHEKEAMELQSEALQKQSEELSGQIKGLLGQVEEISRQYESLSRQSKILSDQKANLEVQITQMEATSAETMASMERYIVKVKADLADCQDLMAEERRGHMVSEEELKEQIAILRRRTENSLGLARQNQLLIAELEELRVSQTAFAREKSVLRGQVQDLHHNTASLSRQNNLLLAQLQQLREVLGQSSLEMETCKAEFIRMGKEKDRLLYRLREIESQKQISEHVRLQFEEEAKSWREKYYAVRR